jgi:hypothetical protein
MCLYGVIRLNTVGQNPGFSDEATMGVYQRKQTGKWCWEIPMRDQDGKKKRVGRYDYDTKDAATMDWIKEKANLKRNTTHLTLRQACLNRLAHLKAYATHPTTYPDNKRMLSRFSVWADLPLTGITITVDIYGHWIPGEGKMDLTRTLRGPKARPGQTLTVAPQGRE